MEVSGVGYQGGLDRGSYNPHSTFSSPAQKQSVMLRHGVTLIPVSLLPQSASPPAGV